MFYDCVFYGIINKDRVEDHMVLRRISRRQSFALIAIFETRLIKIEFLGGKSSFLLLKKTPMLSFKIHLIHQKLVQVNKIKLCQSKKLFDSTISPLRGRN